MGNAHRTLLCLSMLDDIGDGFCEHEIQSALDRGRKRSVLDLEFNLDWNRHAIDEIFRSSEETALHERRWHNVVHQSAEAGCRTVDTSTKFLCPLLNMMLVCRRVRQLLSLDSEEHELGL